MRKPEFGICENKEAADQPLRFATQIVQSIYFQIPKFQASSHFLWLYSPVYVGPGRKPQRQDWFSLDTAHMALDSFPYGLIKILYQLHAKLSPIMRKPRFRVWDQVHKQTGEYSHKKWLEA